MVIRKITKLSDQELSKISGTISLETEEFLDGLLHPISAIYALTTGWLDDEPVSRFLAGGVITSYALVIGVTIYLRYSLPKFYKKTKNAIHK